jgi:CubicO group peptidase (beta-lactamase class C family)
VARSCKTDLLSFARENLFEPMGASLPNWHKATDGYYFGAFGLHTSARDAAKFGSVYLHGGKYRGRQLVPADWVKASLQRYSEDMNFTGWFSSELGDHFYDLGYGYQWWSASAGDHRVDFAWGHGGNLIVLHHGLDMIVVASADPLYEYPEEAGWEYEGAVIDVVGKFIASLPRPAGQ